jgi:predicted DNA-binding ribbon-helix-helix protein
MNRANFAERRIAVVGRSAAFNPGLSKMEKISETPLEQLFNLCHAGKEIEFVPERRSIRLHGHSTTIRLERAFWAVLEELAEEEGITVTALITRIQDHCLITNLKNLASCLRVVCLKYINIMA